jgi:hypothetical protein
MEYLTQVISVLITHTTDASKKEEILVQQLPHSNNSLPLLWVETRQDKERDSIEMINNNNILPYFRKDISTLITISAAAIALLMLASPVLPLSNPLLLQPAQAQTTVTFKTPTNTPATNPDEGWTLTFDAQGTACSSYCNQGQINSGTFQFNDSTPYSDDSDSGKLSNAVTSYFNNDSSGVTILVYYEGTTRNPTIYYQISTTCSTSDDNSISINEQGPDGSFEPQYTLNGAVERTIAGGNTAAQPSPSSPSPSLTVSPQGTDRGGSSSSNSTDNNSGSSSSTNGKDSDSDGIPDSSDNCPHNSHHRCYKEGDNNNDATASTTSTNQQEPQSSSNGSGNQTR